MSTLKQAAFVVVLGIAVTMAGTAAGALIVAPAVSQISQKGWHVSMPTIVLPHVALPQLGIPPMARPTLWRSAFSARAPFALPVLATLLAILALVRLLWTRKGKPLPVGRDAQPLRTDRHPDRTPRAVQALAASGTSPSEISWRTGLPVDAIALLLAISTVPRQLQPPTA